MRLGIMGGTFDPIHYGHLFIAEEARVRYRLSQVLFVPNGRPPHKREGDVTPAEHRLAMVQRAIQSNPHFECSRMELNRPGLSYTVETLTLLRAEYVDAEFFYITGVDAVADILTWKRHEDVIRLATFIAAARPGFEISRLKERLPEDYLARILLLRSTGLEISSTEIRERVRQGLPIRYLMPDTVREYIEEFPLYRAGV